VLGTLDELSDVETDGLTVRARARDGSGALPAVLAALQRRGFPVVSVTVARPTLDDVYMRHAGHSLTGEAPARDGGRRAKVEEVPA